VTNRRILKAGRPRDLEVNSWEVVEEAYLAPAPDEIAVRVAAALLDPLSVAASTGTGLPEVSFSGIISEVGAAVPERLRPGQTVIGIGPPADLITLRSSEVQSLPSDSHLSPQQAAAVPYLCSFLDVLRAMPIKPEDRILITGQAIIRHLSEQFLKALLPGTATAQINSRSSHDIGTERDGSFDVLVHGVTDPLDLDLSLSALDEDGQALLLVPPGSHVLELDFYPHVHRSCLRLLTRRVGSPCRPASCPDPGHQLLSRLLEQESIDIDPLLSYVSDSSQLASLPLEGVNRSEKLLAITWP
jgi:hypothetical protein